MRVFVALCAILMVCVSFTSATEFDVNSINIPAPPAFLEVDESADTAVDESAEVDVASMFSADLANLSGDDVNSNLGLGAKSSGGLDSADWDSLPSDKQVPGDLIRLTNAPGAVPNLSNEILPRSLLPSPDCPNEQHLNDVKLWKTVTKKLRAARTTFAKYKRWTAVANHAVKRVANQIRQTENNTRVLNKAIRGMIRHRKQIVKRLKAYKLQAKLKAAEDKMEKLHKFGIELAVARSKATGGSDDLVTRIKLLKKGFADLQKAGEDA